MKYIIAIILAAVVIFIAISYFNSQSYKYTWWSGTGQVRLCKVPYYDNSECSVVTANSTDGMITGIRMSGNSFYVYDSECFKSESSFDGINRFCRISESGQRYDVLPL